MKVDNFKPQVDRVVFPDGHGFSVLAIGRLFVLDWATDLPFCVVSCSCTNQVLAQLDVPNN